MKILYFNVSELNKGWGAECFVDRGLKSLGHEVINIDYRKHRLNLVDKILSLKDWDIEAVIFQRADHFPIEIIKSLEYPKVFWASELVSRNKDQNLLLKPNLFDHIYLRTPECKKEIIGRGDLNDSDLGIFLSGFDESIHRGLNSTKDIDILFVGNMTPRREEYINSLNRELNITVVSAYGEEFVEYMNRSKVVLNIHADDYLDTETRVYEALGCGSFLISEKLSEECPFLKSEHYIEVGSVDEMISSIKYFLGNIEEREKIAESGHKEALERHTYRKRSEQIVAKFDEILENKNFSFEINRKRLKKYKKIETAKRILPFFKR